VIIGIGIDQVKVDRIEALLEREPERAAERLFSDAERERCGARMRWAECLAARFAAKEAFLKALGTGLSGGISWREIEVEIDANGAPRLRLRGAALRRLHERGGRRTFLSFTHEGGLAVAVAVIEGSEEEADAT